MTWVGRPYTSSIPCPFKHNYTWDVCSVIVVLELGGARFAYGGAILKPLIV